MPVEVSVLIPARDEEQRVAETVRAAARLPGVVEVVVVDDGSRDATAARARAAGARVIRLERNVGKAGAVRAAWPATRADLVLLLDADLGATAAGAAPLLAPVQAGEADMTIGRFPARAWRGGFGLAVGLARLGVRWATGRALAAPLSGQRAVRRQVLAAVACWGRGWGLEVALDLAALAAGFRVVEVPVQLDHRRTGRDLRGFVHRGRQLLDVAYTLGMWTLAGRPGGRAGA